MAFLEDLYPHVKQQYAFIAFEEGPFPAAPTYVPPPIPEALYSFQISLPLTLLDDPVEPAVQPNTGQLSISGAASPLQTWDVRWYFIGGDLPQADYDNWQVELEQLIDTATKGWFKINVTLVAVLLANQPFDYVNWWAALPKQAGMPDLDPLIPEELAQIQIIYAIENDISSVDYLETLYPPGSAGEDITMYTRFETFRVAGGRTRSSRVVESYIKQPWIELDYVNEYGEYRAPTLLLAPGNGFSGSTPRKLHTNIAAHELLHTLLKRPIRNEIDHVNGYALRERYDTTFLEYLIGDPDYAEELGWRETLMCSYRYKVSSTSEVADDQLGPMIARYAPPSLEFNVKIASQPLSTAGQILEVAAGVPVDFLFEAKSVSGLRKVWYTLAGDTQEKYEWDYGGLNSYSRVYEATEKHTVTFLHPGVHTFTAFCRDILYYNPVIDPRADAVTVDNAHQTSDAGIVKEVTIYVV